jgi:4-amino-4-deoxychorismate lyase
MILVNGEARNEVSAMDRGLAYGDGVFRTFPARNGKPVQWQRQYAKLARDAAVLKLQVPQPHALEAEVRTVCSSEPACAVKIILTRGPGARGYGYSGEEKCTRIVAAAPLPESASAQRDTGVVVRRCRLRLSHQPALAGVKHLNRLENVLARAEWSDPRIAEGILCDVEGHVIAGTMTNIFIAVDDALATPKVDRCGVAGVTRDRVIEGAGRRGVACAITTLSWSDVVGADEVFVVNSLNGAWPVRDLDGQVRTPGPMTRQVQGWLEQEDDAQAT